MGLLLDLILQSVVKKVGGGGCRFTECAGSRYSNQDLGSAQYFRLEGVGENDSRLPHEWHTLAIE